MWHYAHVRCPISIHWTINHIGENVVLKDFVKVISTDQKAIYYEGLHIEVNENEYRKQIVSFALQAKELFNKSSEKIILDEFDQSMYTDFWTEYNHLLIIKSTVTSAFYYRLRDCRVFKYNNL